MILKNGSRFYFQICAAFMTNVILLHRSGTIFEKAIPQSPSEIFKRKGSSYFFKTFSYSMCKSNTNELWWFSWLLVVFWRNFAANEIFVNFPRTSEPPIVLVYQNYNWYFAVDASELWIQEGKFALLESWERNFERKCAYLHITAKCSSCIVVMHCMYVWLLWMFELIFVLTWNYI